MEFIAGIIFTLAFGFIANKVFQAYKREAEGYEHVRPSSPRPGADRPVKDYPVGRNVDD